MASREPLEGSFDEVISFLMYHNMQCNPVLELHSCIEKLVELAGEDLPHEVKIRHDYFYGFSAHLAMQEEWSMFTLVAGVLVPFRNLVRTPHSHSPVPLHPCTPVPLHPRISVPTYPRAPVPLHPCTPAPLRPCNTTPAPLTLRPLTTTPYPIPYTPHLFIAL
jgi:hypothetical protein